MTIKYNSSTEMEFFQCCDCYSIMLNQKDKEHFLKSSSGGPESLTLVVCTYAPSIISNS